MHERVSNRVPMQPAACRRKKIRYEIRESSAFYCWLPRSESSVHLNRDKGSIPVTLSNRCSSLFLLYSEFSYVVNKPRITQLHKPL